MKRGANVNEGRKKARGGGGENSPRLGYAKRGGTGSLDHRKKKT